jgi:hypothetical protein
MKKPNIYMDEKVEWNLFQELPCINQSGYGLHVPKARNTHFKWSIGGRFSILYQITNGLWLKSQR